MPGFKYNYDVHNLSYINDPKACCVLILFVTRVEEAGENRVRKGHERFDLSVPRVK